MKKRILVLSLFMTLCMVACGTKEETINTSANIEPVVTAAPTTEPTEVPTEEPTAEPTEAPTPEPTEAPTPKPTEAPTEAPTPEPVVEEPIVEEPVVEEPEDEPEDTGITDWAAQLPAEDRESIKGLLGLTDSELNKLTQSEFDKLMLEYLTSPSGGSGSSGGDSSSSGGNSGSSGGGSSSNDMGGLKPMELIDDEDVLPGSM